MQYCLSDCHCNSTVCVIVTVTGLIFDCVIVCVCVCVCVYVCVFVTVTVTE